MELAYRMDRLEADGRRLIDVASRDLTAGVPACPDWLTADLLAHVCRVWQAIRIQVDGVSDEPARLDDMITPADDGSDLADLARESLDRLVVSLRQAEPEAEVWTWSADRTMGFYQRRAHQETLVHRVDAEQALDDRTPVPAEDGIDGVDELFSLVVADREGPLPAGSLHLHQTDGDGEFMLQVIDGAISVSHEHAKGDAALRASGEDLLLCMWRRRDLEGLECFGDPGIVEEWTRLAP